MKFPKGSMTKPVSFLPLILKQWRLLLILLVLLVILCVSLQNYWVSLSQLDIIPSEMLKRINVKSSTSKLSQNEMRKNVFVQVNKTKKSLYER